MEGPICMWPKPVESEEVGAALDLSVVDVLSVLAEASCDCVHAAK